MLRRLIFIIGTRAQLIKVAPVVLACERLQLSSTLVMTGQHRETMQDLIDEFGIKSPQVAAVEAIERSTIWSLLRWLPAAYKGVKARLKEARISGSDMYVLVHGDTLSTLIGAAAGNRLGAHVVHLESGLTSGKIFDPFPEELCRRIVFHMTNIAICPNDMAANFMKRYRRTVVINTHGNTIVDAIALSGASPERRDLKNPYLLASLHRFHNIYDKSRLHQLVALIEQVSARFPVYFVLHPATRKRLEKENLFQRLSSAPGIRLSPRMGYRDFLFLAAGAACVLTDGGSNQEELAALGVPTVVMRSQTERPDGLGANAVMEADVSGGVGRFILEEGFQHLRRQPLSMHGAGPSHQIAEFLAHGNVGERADKQ
jgi:UDP-N-acetylglucosamine 2-epimerase (non-hydrolysing)